MASNRRKKQHRAKASAKQAETRRRRTATARIHAMQARLERIYDPETPVPELAVLLAVPPGMRRRNGVSSTGRWPKIRQATRTSGWRSSTSSAPAGMPPTPSSCSNRS